MNEKRKKSARRLTTDEFFASLRGRKTVTREEQNRFFEEIENMMKEAKEKHAAR